MGAMPELPDLDILADATHAALAGRAVIGSDVVQPLVMRGTAAELAALDGQVLRASDDAASSSCSSSTATGS